MKKIILLISIMFLLVALPLVSAAWDDNLVSYYNCNSLSDIVSGIDLQNREGTLVFNTTNALIGKSCQFTENNNAYLNNNYTNMKDGTRSINLWFRPENVADEPYPFYATDGNPQFQIFGGQYYLSGFSASLYNANPISNGNWQMLTFVRNSTAFSIYINGSVVQTSTVGSDWENESILLGKQGPGGVDFHGQMDEIGIWGRALNSLEVTQLYNGGSGITFEDLISSPNVSLSYPPINYNSSLETVIFNGTVSDDLGVINVSLYLDGVLNETNSSGLNNSLYTFSKVFSEGLHNWTFKACDTSSECTTATTRNFTVDLNPPIINNLLPVNSSTTVITTQTYNISLNASITDTVSLFSCWYGNGTINTTVTCGNNATINLTGGTYTYTWYANDTAGNEVNNATTFILNYVQENKAINPTVIEGQQTNIYLNITSTEITSFNGTLYYNNTAYTTTNTSNSTYGVLNTTITAPLVSANTLVNVSWVYNLNGIQYNSSVYNQTIQFLTSLNVTSESCSDKALRFDLQDEENLTAVNGSVEYNFKFGLSNSSLKQTYGSLTGVSTFYVCINASVSTNYTLGYGEIQYQTGTNYVDRRYYLFENQTISNNTLTNHTLRDLLSSEQTSFLMTFEDTSLNKYIDKYTALWRWYPDLNAYQIVEMGKTDEQGETVSHVNTEDTDYRVGVYHKNGSLIKLGDPLRFICSTAPCTFILRVGAGDLDYRTFFDVETSLTWNDTTQLFTLIYNDPNQLTSNMRLLVTRETGSSTLTICDDTSSGFTGVITCNTSAYTGLKKAVAFRSASPAKPIAQLWSQTVNETFKSGFGLFISIFLWLGIVLTGLGNNPLWTIILTVVGLIPALLLGSINVAIFTGVAVLGAIVIHFIKRTLTN